MHDPIMSPRLFDIIITVLVSLGVFWVMLDVFFITRLRGKDMKDATNRDKLFGYLIGITIGCFVTVGILRHHGVV
jgi:succinate-acetate transporter protein